MDLLGREHWKMNKLMKQLRWWLLVVVAVGDENSIVIEELKLIEHISIMDEDYSRIDNVFSQFDDEFHCNTRLNH